MVGWGNGNQKWTLTVTILALTQDDSEDEEPVAKKPRKKWLFEVMASLKQFQGKYPP